MGRLGPFEENSIVCGDCVNHLHDLPDESVTAVLTDPPYGLAFMGKKWDSFKNNAQYQAWVTEWAAELLRVCKPGAVGLFFGGTRTFHRLACGLEDAGWEVYDTLMWVYGSGFPKSHDISKAIDKAAGAEREVIGKYQYPDGNMRHKTSPRINEIYGKDNRPFQDYLQRTAPATDAARQWQGWGTALKPAWEPIILARKPRRGTYAECAVEHGAGALWIDGCRIAIDDKDFHMTAARIDPSPASVAVPREYGERRAVSNPHPLSLRHNAQGRWPSNIIFSHHPECVRVGTKKVRGIKGGNSTNIGGFVTAYTDESKRGMPCGYADEDGLEPVEDWDCHPDCPVRQLDEMSGKLKSGALIRSQTAKAETGKHGIYGRFNGTPDGKCFEASTGGASRFFYCAKASRGEREAGLETEPEEYRGTMGKFRSNPGRTVQKGGGTPTYNPHPTVKPLALTEYLARLIRPPEAYLDEAVILVPFCGTGSEIIGAIKAGWRRWLGIEISEEYVGIARARIAYWQKRIEVDHEKRAQLEMGL